METNYTNGLSNADRYTINAKPKVAKTSGKSIDFAYDSKQGSIGKYIATTALIGVAGAALAYGALKFSDSKVMSDSKKSPVSQLVEKVMGNK